jgi:prepilin-type N-terminal cleavage/methylation domain-containing protein
MKRGLTLVEVLVTIAIGLIVVGTVFGAFVTFNKRQAVDKNVFKVYALLEEARSRTLSARSDSQYGVHFLANQVSLFSGSTFASSSIITTVTFPPSVSASTTLTSGGVDVIFTRITGSTVNSGTSTLSIAGSATSSRSLIIYKTGLIEAN